LGNLFFRTFARPASDSGYHKNWLQPGALPIEWSFSETDPRSLRIELQPFDPTLSGKERFKCTVEALIPVVEAHHGKDSATQFELAVSNASAMDSMLRFGAEI
jgi:hypothetical protein